MPLGIERKAEVAGGNQLHSPRKKRKTEHKWTCPLCQVSSTSEQGLQDHFEGMMHKAKEASLRKTEKLNQKICSPDPFPNDDDEEKSQVNEKHKDKNFWCPICEISTNNEALMKMHWSGKKHMARLRKKSGALEAISSLTDDAQNIGETTATDEEASPINAEGTEETGAGEDTSKEQDKLLLNKRQTNPTFWCQTCKIGTTGEDSMKEHQKGKKHIAKLRKESGTLIGISSSLPDEAQDVGETRAMEEDTSLSNAGRTEEIEAQDYTCKGDKLIQKKRQMNGELFWCQTCKIGTTSEGSMKEHQKGKKHKAKLMKKSETLIGISCPLPDEAQNVGETTATEEDASPSNAERTEETEAQDDMTEEGDKLVVNKKHTNLKFWCETCKIGTESEESMKEHQNGKEHMNLLRKSGGETTAEKKMNDSMANAHTNKETEVVDETKMEAAAWQQ